MWNKSCRVPQLFNGKKKVNQEGFQTSLTKYEKIQRGEQSDVVVSSAIVWALRFFFFKTYFLYHNTQMLVTTVCLQNTFYFTSLHEIHGQISSWYD